MDSSYHLKLVLNETTGYHRTANDQLLVAHAQNMYPTVISAIDKVIVDGEYDKYVESIGPYDRFIWEESHRGDKTNLFSYKKIKVSPTWTEQLWAPVFERVRLQLEKQWADDLRDYQASLVLLQNTQTVTFFTTNNYVEYKDVDCGIGIKVWINSIGQVILPVVVCESKTGHFCKTACTGVDGIARRVLDLNPNVLAFTVTDNNISVGRDVEVDHVYGSGGILIMHRGSKNKSREDYPALHPNKFKLVEEGCNKYLSTKSVLDFTTINQTQTSGVKLIDAIKTNGYYAPPALTQYF